MRRAPAIARGKARSLIFADGMRVGGAIPCAEPRKLLDGASIGDRDCGNPSGEAASHKRKKPMKTVFPCGAGKVAVTP